MAKIMLHHGEARAALARGVAKLTLAVQGTMGPKGTNAIIDRPIGTPLISRDGVSIAAEIELEDRFENMGAQVVREVSKQTNDVAGDGTTTATVLANALIQGGVKVLDQGQSAVDLVAGIELACAHVIEALRRQARPLPDDRALEQVAVVAATEPALGRLVAEAVRRVGPDGIIEVEHGVPGEPTRLDVLEGMSFDRGYLSHHMATDPETMEAVLEQPLILITDNRIPHAAALDAVLAEVARQRRPLLVIAEEIAPDAVARLIAARRQGCIAVAVNPPDYGHWRKAMLEDLAILTGGRVLARELGGRVEAATAQDLGQAERIRVMLDRTAIVGGGGAPEAIRARRAQIERQLEAAPQNVERDKLAERLARLTGGTAILVAGGATPVEQKRAAQLLEDALNAARGARMEGVVPGGGTALAQMAPELDALLAGQDPSIGEGIRLVQRALEAPLACIAENAGFSGREIAAQVVSGPAGVGFDAATGQFVDLVAAGIMDPVKVIRTSVANAASVAKLILTTHTLIADRPEHQDPTAGPALGAGAERLGRP
ncbi:molecular chaperone GroEL [Benzoatithermus flavus]|uniref:60 kDa chaperonin n=1 Tax=Benzoatithermus flavus TaxID=3108223 RepID=A0ABU8Y1G1_9PROT